jgi:TolB-like protein/Flp pilus assembly protein TadD
MASKTPHIPNPHPAASSGDRLDSWKEIATYLKCSERSVRRWEGEGLPVHRHPHKKKAGIYAYRVELDAWWNDGHERLKEIERARIDPRRQRSFRLRRASVGIALCVIVLFGLGMALLRHRLFPAPVPAAPVIRSLAVLPLENLSHDPQQEYFADGMTDELITNLAKIGALHVISRTSVMPYKGRRASAPEIARELNVDALIEGTVLRAGDRVRITAQLIDARSDRHLWAQAYEGNLRDVLALQDNVAQDIANKVNIELTPQQQERLSNPRTVNPAAHEAYLRGLYELHGIAAEANGDQKSQFIERAIDYFQRAAALDPTDARSYAGLADSYYALSTGDKAPLEVMPKAEAAALKAISLDDTVAEAHASLGQIAFFYDWDAHHAEQEFRKALALNPSLPQAHSGLAEYLLLAGGRPDEAIAELKRAYALDPLLPLSHGSLASFLFMARRYPESLAAAQQVGDDSGMALAYAELGHGTQAIAAVDRFTHANLNPVGMAEAATVYAMAGRKDKARKLLQQVVDQASKRYICGYNVACIYAALGDKDQAIAWLNRAFLSRSD